MSVVTGDWRAHGLDMTGVLDHDEQVVQSGSVSDAVRAVEAQYPGGGVIGAEVHVRAIRILSKRGQAERTREAYLEALAEAQKEFDDEAVA
jgi:hypothetical protein